MPCSAGVLGREQDRTGVPDPVVAASLGNGLSGARSAAGAVCAEPGSSPWAGGRPAEEAEQEAGEGAKGQWRQSLYH